MLLDDGEELDGHAAGLFYAALPLLHRGLAGVEVAGKDRLADTLALANPLDLLRRKALGDGETGRVEVPHRRLVECAQTTEATIPILFQPFSFIVQVEHVIDAASHTAPASTSTRPILYPSRSHARLLAGRRDLARRRRAWPGRGS